LRWAYYRDIAVALEIAVGWNLHRYEALGHLPTSVGRGNGLHSAQIVTLSIVCKRANLATSSFRTDFVRNLLLTLCPRSRDHDRRQEVKSGSFTKSVQDDGWCGSG
jgi:hypothetical protein